MRFSVLIASILLAACSKESDQAKSELDIVEAAQANQSGGRKADNVQLCAAHRKLQNAYLVEKNSEQYERQRIFVTAYC